MIDQALLAWPWFVAMQPFAGLLFALDGVLLGAGDTRFLRNLTIVAGFGVFLPGALLAGRLDLGLGGVWAALTLFIVVRLVGMLLRVRSRPVGEGRRHGLRPPGSEAVASRGTAGAEDRRRRQAGRDDVARRRGPGAAAGRHPAGRARRHARPDGDRRAGDRRRAGDPAAHLRGRQHEAVPRRRSGWASRRSPTTPRARSPRRADAHGRHRTILSRKRHRGPDRRDPAGAQRGERDQDQGGAGVRAGAQGRGRWSWPPGRSRCRGFDLLATRRDRRRRSTWTSTSSARRAPTSGRWPATWAPHWASAGT